MRPSPLARAIGAAALAFALLQALLGLWAHHAFEGRYESLFLMSETFGLPQVARDAGFRPAVTPADGHIGWDGQFFYHLSNDPFGTGDAAAHLDSVTYRYQRIGVPLLAWAVSRTLGESVTSPYLYLTVQNALVALGFGGLVGWLASMGVSGWPTLAWLGCGGTLYASFYGLPDGAADALFVLSFLALWHRRLGWYLLVSSMLVLTREGYAVFAAAAFVAGLCGWVRWPAGRWRGPLLTALPGVLAVGWAVYLSAHFGVGLSSAERNPSVAYGWPAWEALKSLAHAWDTCERDGVAYRLVALGTLAVVSWRCAAHARSHPALACALPYLALTLCLGPVVWVHHQGYFKATGAAVALGVLLLPLDRSRLLRVALVANLLAGLHWNLLCATTPAPLVSPNGPEYADGPLPPHPFNTDLSDRTRMLKPVPGHADNAPLPALAFGVEWLDERQTLQRSYRGLWQRWHRELVPLRVRVTNRGPVAWGPNPRVGANALHVVAVLLDENRRVLLTTRVPLDAAVPPGEARELTVWLRVGRRGSHHLHLAVEQVGAHPFDPHRSKEGVHRVVGVR